MKDSSRRLYHIYFNNKHCRVRIILNDQSIHTGKIVGFFRSSFFGDPWITHWHITTVEGARNLGKGIVGNPIGIIIQHKDISSVEFLHDEPDVKLALG
jgi:hypothetical protein